MSRLTGAWGDERRGESRRVALLYGFIDELSCFREVVGTGDLSRKPDPVRQGWSGTVPYIFVLS